MKNILLTFVTITLFSTACAFNDVFLAYCKLTNLAESHIMDGAFQDALICYDSAFTLYSQPLAKDIHNAIICTEKIKNEQKTKEYLNLMIETKSLAPIYYKKWGFLKYLTKERKWDIRKKYAEKINSKDYLFVQQLIEEDQAIRTPKNYTQKYHLIQKTDSLTYAKYVAYFGDYFPGEELTLDYPSSQGIDWILFRHWTANKSLGFEAVKRTQKMVENLKFLNYDYAFFYDAKLGNIVNNLGYGLTLEKKYINKKTRRIFSAPRVRRIQYSSENIIAINERRSEIGLDTHDEYVRKIDFFVKNKEYYFPTGYYSITIN